MLQYPPLNDLRRIKPHVSQYLDACSSMRMVTLPSRLMASPEWNPQSSIKSSVMILTAVVFEVLHIPAPYLFLNPIFFDNQFNLNPFHIILCSPPSPQEKVCRFCMDLIADQGVYM